MALAPPLIRKRQSVPETAVDASVGSSEIASSMAIVARAAAKEASLGSGWPPAKNWNPMGSSRGCVGAIRMPCRSRCAEGLRGRAACTASRIAPSIASSMEGAALPTARMRMRCTLARSIPVPPIRRVRLPSGEVWMRTARANARATLHSANADTKISRAMACNGERGTSGAGSGAGPRAGESGGSLIDRPGTAHGFPLVVSGIGAVASSLCSIL